MEQGLPEEVEALRKRGLKRENVSMQGLGYKELFGYFEGEYPLEESSQDHPAGYKAFRKASADVVQKRTGCDLDR